MKTLVLLSALVLPCFQVQADPIQNTDEETKTEEQPEEEDQAVSVSFGGTEGSALQDVAQRRFPWCRKCRVCQKCQVCQKCPVCPTCPQCPKQPLCEERQNKTAITTQAPNTQHKGC
uniref:Alpha-defensin 29 n=1 Tax=Mus musculus TaxID=10090 RepID=DFA29_MOUSE|nr:RecName: Full=Alpha-defensin 29; AltName: Full=Alpha-defensin-related sequence 1; AltName: Full=CRS1C; AltName: Full=Cryptdin-related protein 1C; AltName: Full=Defensin-related cryptdin-related sequence 1; Flags: Precursor [Mus musculus]AAA18201.1 cryptdin-related protein 1C [Mus musculus]AAB31356.1 cationic, cysteine-rich peptide {clone CRS1C} [mice, small intestine cells, Peptide Partial, 116 aa] [Mus sp.]